MTKLQTGPPSRVTFVVAWGLAVLVWAVIYVLSCVGLHSWNAAGN